MTSATIIDRNQTLDFSTIIKLIALGMQTAGICKQLVTLKNRCKKFEQIKARLKRCSNRDSRSKRSCINVSGLTRTLW